MRVILPLSIVLLALVGCSGEEGEQTPGENLRRTPITAAALEIRRAETVERSVGRLTSPEVPLLRAETSGKVLEITVDAGSLVEPGDLLVRLDDEVAQLRVDQSQAALQRIRVQLDNATRSLSRQIELQDRQLVSASVVEDAEAAQQTLQAQLREAQVALEQAQWSLQQTRILSPLSAMVQQRRVAVGDLVQTGEPVLELVASEQLRAVLPFPQTLLGRIERGQRVRLSLPEAPEESVEGAINQIRPLVGAGNRAVEVIVGLSNPGGWKVGGSVLGTLVLDVREDAVLAPALSVVQRPDGDVVYVIEDGQVRQQKVVTGITENGWIEIREGLQGDERVALRGAGFLTDGAPVSVQESAP